MRKLTKLLALLLTLTLILAIPTVALASRPEVEEWQEGSSASRVDEIEIEGRTCYMYVPQSPRTGNLLQNTNCFFVFGDGKFADAKAVEAFAKETGIADICALDGTCALFFNPLTTWAEEADPNALIVGGYNMFSTWPDLKFVDGVANEIYHPNAAAGGNGMFGARLYPLDLPKYPGSFQHTIFFGFGTGADFVNAKGMEPQVFMSTYGYQDWASDAFGMGQTPAGVYLYNPTTLVAGDGSLTIPTVIVNGPANAGEVIASYSINAAGTVSGKVLKADGYDPAGLVKVYNDVLNTGNTRYWYNGLTELGLRYEYTNALGQTDWLKYYAYIPDNVDLTAAASAPMLIWCHGAGGEGESQCDWSGWITKAEKEGFIVLSLDQHWSVPGDVIIAMIDQFIADHPVVDATRLYYGGFSMGSMKTWQVISPYWYRFAAAIPNAGSAMFGMAPMTEDAMLPIFYIAGGLSAMEFGAGLTNTMVQVWKQNDIGEYVFDAEKGFFGVDADTFEIYGHSGSGADDNKQLYVYGFESGNGETITWLSICPNRAHTVVATDPDIVWEYIKGFTRNADGTLCKDGKVISTVLAPQPEPEPEPETPLKGLKPGLLNAR